jgi:peptidoglycan/LPS O-acetylase OafA/YrhL
MASAFSNFLEKFRRITSGSAGYLPEIDGLRFIAIAWVVVLMHLPNIINYNLYGKDHFNSNFLAKMVLEGGNGVSLFFMISGFILAIPFLKEKIYHEKKIVLKKYYLRRLTRLEPPYIAALLIAFFGLILVGNYTFNGLVDNLLASLFYMHNWIYQSHSRVLTVAWSLEVETRFYILAPFLSFIFLVKNEWLRRSVLIIAIVAGYIKQYYDIWNPASPFLNFLAYFLAGMLLADLYLSKWKLVSNSKFSAWIGMLLFLGMHFIFSTNNLVLFFSKMLALFIFFYIAVTNPFWKKLLATRWISIIGGMCYSIYLVHFMVMAGITRVLQEFPIENKIIGFGIYGSILILAVLAFSMLFYRFIEQPCMRKDWYKKFSLRKKIPSA